MYDFLFFTIVYLVRELNLFYFPIGNVSYYQPSTTLVQNCPKNKNTIFIFQCFSFIQCKTAMSTTQKFVMFREKNCRGRRPSRPLTENKV